jgi:hypothetical protein
VRKGVYVPMGVVMCVLCVFSNLRREVAGCLDEMLRGAGCKDISCICILSAFTTTRGVHVYPVLSPQHVVFKKAVCVCLWASAGGGMSCAFELCEGYTITRSALS